ncbi:hypothetical protein KP509_32G031900 [Ceratopteris richardii]|nr:hypothetical protein KP509_32G031900 [Ceratopteris richardii]
MCFSLPTPEDPFNDSYKEHLASEKPQKSQKPKSSGITKGSKSSNVESNNEKERVRTSKASIESSLLGSITIQQSSAKNDVTIEPRCPNYECSSRQHQTLSIDNLRVKWKPNCGKCLMKDNSWTCIGDDAFEVAICALLKAKIIKIDNHEKIVREKSMPLRQYINKLDWMFWEACGKGSDILATGRITGMPTHISNVLAVVGHMGQRIGKQIHGKCPLVLLLVHSKEQALEVRSIFRLLKSQLGIHAVSLHTGTPLEHQIKGLDCTEFDVLVATPERLDELLSINAVSISNISLMIVDGLEDMALSGLSDYLLNIKRKASNNVQTIVSSRAFLPETYHICRKLLQDPICRVISDSSMSQSCACISQNVHVLVSEDKRNQKLQKILSHHIGSREKSISSGSGILVLFQHLQSLLHVKGTIQKDYTVGVLCVNDLNEDSQSAHLIREQFRKGQIDVLLATEDCISQIDLSSVSLIVLHEFTANIESYCKILTTMARFTINGVLYTFCSGATAPLASQLIDVLHKCLQPIPPPLKMLADAAKVVVEKKG